MIKDCFLNTTRNHTSNSNVRVHFRSICALDHFQRTSSVSKIFDWSSEQCHFHIRSAFTRPSRILSGKCVLNSKAIGRWNNLRRHKESVFQGHTFKWFDLIFQSGAWQKILKLGLQWSKHHIAHVDFECKLLGVYNYTSFAVSESTKTADLKVTTFCQIKSYWNKCFERCFIYMYLPKIFSAVEQKKVVRKSENK